MCGQRLIQGTDTRTSSISQVVNCPVARKPIARKSDLRQAAAGKEFHREVANSLLPIYYSDTTIVIQQLQIIK